jgi:transcriptional regulator with XRE-family HTH domain
MNDILKKIKKIRKEKRMSQRELAVRLPKEIKVTQQIYSKIEKGDRALLVEHLIEISKALEVPTSYFFDEEEIQKKEAKVNYKVIGEYRRENNLLYKHISLIEEELDRLKKMVSL